ncbi:MAG TPA: choice-of-anchor tandem repeat GloVer-containing protein, partial [Verrucomicrobiaceae bacterium]
MKLHGTLLFFVLAAILASPVRAVDTLLHSFSAGEGTPAFFGSLTPGDGVLFGMTANGGSSFLGSIFRVNPDGSGYALIHSFSYDGVHSDGASPLSSLTWSNGVLYGMTPFGGEIPPMGPPANCGAVFRLNPDGGGFEVLHGFTGNELAGSGDGGKPSGAVTVFDSTIFGMTRFGGSSARGTIFSMSTDGGGFQILHHFSGGTNDGADPQGTLTLVGSKLCGVTNAGGANDEGTVFVINTDGSEFTVLHSFDPFESGAAVEPVGGNGLTVADNKLHGMTFNGGAEGYGAIFSLNLDGSEFESVYDFTVSDGGGNPTGSLTWSGDHFYGTTSGYAGLVGNGPGCVFGVSPDGAAFTVIQSFMGPPADGIIATGDLTLSSDGGVLLGTAQYGGIYNNGTIYSVPASGSLTNADLFSLTCSAGALSPVFDRQTTRYTVQVSDATAAMGVTPTSADGAATLTVNGSSVTSGALSAWVSLSPGINDINILVTARDGVTTKLYTVAVVRLTPLQNWRVNHFGSSLNAGPAANDADPLGDGISNLVKYAFGLEPATPALNQMPQPAFAADRLGFTFTEPAGVGGIAYGAEWTRFLNPPSWQPLPDSGSGSLHEFQAYVGDVSSAFMRLKVSAPLSPIEELGESIFFDDTLSNPAGVSCASCHAPPAGFTGPNSEMNLAAGPLPGAVSSRFGPRKPQAIAYAIFSPSGPYFDHGQGLWSGGSFWDGHAATQADQARMPFIGPNEMANDFVGSLPPRPGGYSPMVAQKLAQRPYVDLFRQVFGAGIFAPGNEASVSAMAAQAIAAYEASEVVNPFSSKFDASQHATPPANAYQFTPSEQNGMALFFGKAQCFACHSSAALDSVSSMTNGREVFTMYCYASIGTPKNPDNPFYQNTDSENNPNGYNPLGAAFIDFGLGGNPNPAPGGLRFMNDTPGDIVDFRGLFKAPSLRNVDRRPSPDFVKSYMHNGVFKSLEEVVQFYNKRNIAVNAAGQEVAFDLRDGPPPGCTRLFPPPEVIDNVQNVAGLTPAQTRQGEADVARNGQIGHLELTPEEE